MLLIVALGNPGKEYQLTRHNFSFLALDEIIHQHNLTGPTKKFQSELYTGEINSQKIIAIKPQTYMNLSGNAVIEATNFFKIPPENVIVIHDEIDISFGEIRIKQGGGNAGHNGLKSIDSKIGKNYHRIRLGIGRPQHQEQEVSDYVLSKFNKEQNLAVQEITHQLSSQSLPELISTINNKD